MNIYIEELKAVNGDFKYIPLINYRSNSIPRKNEYLHLVHFGLFVVTDVIYRISDDNETIGGNTCMWVEIRVEKVK